MEASLSTSFYRTESSGCIERKSGNDLCRNNIWRAAMTEHLKLQVQVPDPRKRDRGYARRGSQMLCHPADLKPSCSVESGDTVEWKSAGRLACAFAASGRASTGLRYGSPKGSMC